jgi:hypothetical protein
MRFEIDLENSFISEKVQQSEIYAQNLYAALCNTGWRCDDPNTSVFSITWRGAGGVVANIRNTGGDYLDWYCSGIGSRLDGVVPEGTVTDEIAQDLNAIGWYLVVHTEP